MKENMDKSTKMNMYYWYSYTYKDYAMGSIICMAPTPAAARKQIAKKFKNHIDYESIMRDVSSDPIKIDDGILTMTGSA